MANCEIGFVEAVLTQCHLTPRSSGRVRDKVPSSYVGVRAAPAQPLGVMNCSQLYVGATRPLAEISSEFIVLEALGPKDGDRDAVAAFSRCQTFTTSSRLRMRLGISRCRYGMGLASRNALEAYLRSEVAIGPVLLMSINVDTLGSSAPAWDRKTVSLMSEFDGWRVPYGMKAVACSRRWLITPNLERTRDR